MVQGSCSSTANKFKTFLRPINAKNLRPIFQYKKSEKGTLKEMTML